MTILAVGSRAESPPLRARVPPVGRVAQMLRHPAMPASLAAGLLFAGYALAAAQGEQELVPPAALVTIALFCAAMAFLGDGKRLEIPKLPERAAAFLRVVSLIAISVEFLYFGIPLLGSIPYNEFGWPVVHHLAVMHWLLVLFASKRRNLDFVISLVIAVALFNRQMALFAILSYLLTTSLPTKRLLTSGFVVATLLLLLGVLRNRVLEVDTAPVDEGFSVPLSGAAFFIYLYLTGPLYSALELSSDLWDNQLSAYWNTVPEWAHLSATSDVPPAQSFALFYGLCAMVALGLRRSRSWELQCLGTLIHVYSFFCFFSGVLLSTPVIAHFLALILAGYLFPRRRLQ